MKPLQVQPLTEFIFSKLIKKNTPFFKKNKYKYVSINNSQYISLTMHYKGSRKYDFGTRMHMHNS